MKYLVSTLNYSGAIWHHEYFNDENQAREYANAEWKAVPLMVELYVNTRSGYTLIKRARRTRKQQTEDTARMFAEEF